MQLLFLHYISPTEVCSVSLLCGGGENRSIVSQQVAVGHLTSTLVNTLALSTHAHSHTCTHTRSERLLKCLAAVSVRTSSYRSYKASTSCETELLLFRLRSLIVWINWDLIWLCSALYFNSSGFTLQSQAKPFVSVVRMNISGQKQTSGTETLRKTSAVVGWCADPWR